MLFRRFAVAVALVAAALASQLPEYTEQYRQRLGGALDELDATLSRFDAEAASEGLARNQGIARLKANGDTLAQNRGADLEDQAARFERLKHQRDAFQTAGPLSQYAVLAEGLDLGLARRTASDFQPAVPVTVGGLVAAACGFALAWILLQLVATPFRRSDRRQVVLKS